MSHKAMFDFYCEHCGNRHERYVYAELEASLCGCGKMAKKALSAPSYFKIDGFRSEINGDKWAKTREDNAKRKANQE